MFRLIYKYSASVLVETSDIRILCDPWFGSAYYGTWGQYPQVSSLEEFVGDFDCIFISHIHPDHYCPTTLNRLFARYGKKSIIVADWGEKPNYLRNKLQADGFGNLTICKNNFIINDTLLFIVPNVTESNSDIDSALLVHETTSNKTLLNLNDCLNTAFLKKSVHSILADLNTSITLLCAPYTGAGPYPQTYYSPITDRQYLTQKALEKKRQFFNRYNELREAFPSHRRLPFAGKYILQGDLSFLNPYRGVADALEVKDFDKGAIVLDDSGNSYYDLVEDIVFSERNNLYHIPEANSNPTCYEWQTMLNHPLPNQLLKRLLKTAIMRAHKKSTCLIDAYWIIHVYGSKEELSRFLEDGLSFLDDSNHIHTFNCNKSKQPLCTESLQESEIVAHMYIEKTALFGALTGLLHWNNLEVGSAFQVRRTPDRYHQPFSSYLHFLSVV